MDDLVINDRITIPASDFEVSFSRASGPGGQHVNTTDTRVRLHFHFERTEALHSGVKRRMREAYANRINKDGVLVLTADTHRSRHRNVEEVRDRLKAMVDRCLAPPTPRKKTGPSKAAKRRRLDSKKRRGDLKSSRSKVKYDG